MSDMNNPFQNCFFLMALSLNGSKIMVTEDLEAWLDAS